ncbi:MAG: FAD-linked oxidase C-terminal domain-containing protein [Hyphomicrobiaceae bacterium]
MPSSPSRSPQAALDLLRQRFGDRLETGLPIRTQHAHSLTWVTPEPPDAVLFAETEADITTSVEICRGHRLPIIPFGAGTSLEGQVNAPRGGLSIDLSRMNRILAVNHGDLDVVVETGVTRKQLNEHLRDLGLFFPVDPGAEHATLGGMASTRASGTMAVRYGTMRENVLSLRAVMADGSIVTTSRRSRKSSAGYDLTRLLVGAEGTLGIITELTLRVYGIPETVLAAVCPFKTLEGACNTVIQSIQLGLGLARMELIDELQIKGFNLHSGTSFAEQPTLFLEFHGTPAATAEQIVTFRAIAESEGALGFEQAERPEDRNRLWKARHDAYWSAKALRPGADLFATDVSVPISRLADCILETRRDQEASGIVAPLVGHVGDGNFHLVPLFDLKDATEVAKIKAFTHRLVERALAMGGTSTGEHGIGQGKMGYMAAEHGTGLRVMRAIKQALDPEGLLNPGKILPPA